MSPDEMRAVVERHIAAEARHDAQEAASYYVAHGEYYHASLGIRFAGREAVAAQYANSYLSLPDLEATVEKETAGKSSLVHHGRIKGTMNGAFLGVPATGRQVDVPLLAIYDFEDGQILRETVHYDLEDFCAQLGLDLDVVRGNLRAYNAAMAAASA